MFMSQPAKPFIIGEAGVNHNGSLSVALDLVEAAAASGCDAVKFQTWRTERVYSPALSLKPAYQLAGTPADESEFDTIRKLELSYDDFREIKTACDRRGITFISTPDEIESAEFLVGLGVPFLKIASQDVTNVPLLEQFSQLGVPLLVSTGAATLAEVAAAVEAVSRRCNDVALLHCVSSYPVAIEYMNLGAITRLSSAFGLPVGLSDHSVSADAALVAVGLGARIFEKHLTLDSSAEGPDHQASMMPDQLKDYGDRIRAAFDGLGNGVKRVMAIEEDVREAFSRYLVANSSLPAGHVVAMEDLDFRKTAGGIAPKHLDLVVGATLRRSVFEGTTLTWDLLELR